MKKSLKKLLPTLALVVVTASLMGTATFAWFTMNTTATVTGMKVNIETYDNLLVAPTSGSANSAAENEFKNTLTITEDATKIAPTSSIDARNFYYIDNRNATAAGNVIVEEYKTYNETDFKAAYRDAVGYKDFDFELKAINGNIATDVMDLRLTKLALQYTGNKATAVSKIKAFRVAVFMTEEDATYPATDVGVTFDQATAVADTTVDVKSIYAPAGAATFTATGGKTYAIATNDNGTPGDASDDVNEATEVTYNAIASTAATKEFSTLNDETVKYFKVTIRIWVEGEDTTCFNEAYVTLDQDWHLDLAFDLVTASATENNVDNLTIANNQPATIAYATDTLTAALANGKTAKTYQWYKDGSAVDDEDEKDYDISAVTGNHYYYCVITATDLSVYTTPTMYLPAVIADNANGTYTAKLTNGATGTTTYQWKKDGSAVDGANNATYKPVASGKYTCEIKVGDNTYVTNEVDVTVA